MDSTLPSGILLIDKATDMTSHDVVAIARRSLGIKKIGHCGTLDPMATGLLILVINKATKLQDLLMAEHKEYQGTLELGLETSSYDLQGEVLARHSVNHLTPDQVTAAFESYRGTFDQMPPMVSAIKKDGVPLYKLARKGQVVEREARSVTLEGYQIHRIELPEVDFTIQCSKGFYVRSLAHDIGEKLHCGACLSRLRRTKSGEFSVSQAIDAMALKTLPRTELYSKIVSISQIAAMRGIR